MTDFQTTWIVVGSSLGLIAASAGLYFWGLGRSKAGAVVIYADREDARMGSAAALTTIGASILLAIFLESAKLSILLALVGLVAYPTFWVFYRSAVYNPTPDTFWLGLILRVNAVFLQVVTFFVFLVIMVVIASRRDEMRKRGEHVSAAVERAQDTLVALIFAVIMFTIADKAVNGAPPSYQGVTVPSRYQGVAIVAWALAICAYVAPFAFLHFHIDDSSIGGTQTLTSSRDAALSLARREWKRDQCELRENSLEALSGRIDGKDVIVATYGVEGCGGGNAWFHILELLTIESGEAVKIAETSAAGFDDPVISDGSLVATVTTWGPGDAHCCPSTKYRVSFDISGERLIPRKK